MMHSSAQYISDSQVKQENILKVRMEIFVKPKEESSELQNFLTCLLSIIINAYEN